MWWYLITTWFMGISHLIFKWSKDEINTSFISVIGAAIASPILVPMKLSHKLLK